jgi:arylsulfatase A-like enzyme
LCDGIIVKFEQWLLPIFMNTRHTHFIIRLLFVGFCFQLTACDLINQNKSSAPNILIILADDMGYGDLKVYNPASMVPTPNLDRLAQESLRFTNAYCPVSVCSPTRYALMTGRYPWRSWRKTGVMRNYERSMIGDEIITLPEMLQQAGYNTVGLGKWHLGTQFPTLDGEKPVGHGKFRADDNGANIDLDGRVWDGPLDHGFDNWVGFSCASETWILENNEISGAIGHDLYTIEKTPGKESVTIIPLEDYLPFITDHAVKFLKTYRNRRSNPFFLYFAPYVPHIPLAVEQKFRGATEAGLYGDYVHELDFYIGKVLDQLQASGLAENTIVIFASDNGSQFLLTSPELDKYGVSNSPQDILQIDSLEGHHPNGQLRGTKWSIYEGGVRTPLMVRWPGKVAHGSISNEVVGLNDIISTISEISPRIETPTTATDSESFYNLLVGSEKERIRQIVVQSSGRDFGLRSGEWKYIFKIDGEISELYNLQEDPGELNNLIGQQPDISERMHYELISTVGEGIDLGQYGK